MVGRKAVPTAQAHGQKSLSLDKQGLDGGTKDHLTGSNPDRTGNIEGIARTRAAIRVCCAGVVQIRVTSGFSPMNTGVSRGFTRTGAVLEIVGTHDTLVS